MDPVERRQLETVAALAISVLHSMSDKLTALKRDFNLPHDTPIPGVVEKGVVELQLNLDPNLTLRQKVELIYEQIHGPDRPATSEDEIPIAQGVRVGGRPEDDAPITVVGEAIGQQFNRMPTGVPTVKQALQDAVAIGAPAYNSGDHEGCYVLYKMTCAAIAERFSAGSIRENLLATIQDAEQVVQSSEDWRGFSRAAWMMREEMDRLLHGQANPPLEGMPRPSELWEEHQRTAARHASPTVVLSTTGAVVGTADDAATTASGHYETENLRIAALPPSGRGQTTVKRAIQEVIELGAPAYNRGNKAGCYYLYKRTAEEIVRRLPAQHRWRGALSEAMHRGRTLSQDRDDADGAAWAIRICFDEILASTSNEPLGNRMPTALSIKKEPGFRGGRVGSESCVVS
jgi:hypothetical protein